MNELACIDMNGLGFGADGDSGADDRENDRWNISATPSMHNAGCSLFCPHLNRKFRLYIHLLPLILGCLVPAGYAQITSDSEGQSRPSPGGHDYVQYMDETVTPENGQLSIRIDVPLPAGRGPHVPFHVTYDSNGIDTSSSLFSLGGWGYSVPQISVMPMTLYGIMRTSPVVVVAPCNIFADYVFYAPGGDTHPFEMSWFPSTAQQCTNPPDGFQAIGQFTPNAPVLHTADNDDQYQASLELSGSTYTSQPIVAGADGSVYSFSSEKFSIPYCCTGNTALYSPLSTIEDTNGNIFTVAYNSSTTGFTYTDSSGRQILSSSGFGTSGNTLTVSGVTQPYTVTWGTITYSNPSQNSTLYYSSGVCSASSLGGGAATRNAITSIVLPNGDKYLFAYDSTYGRLSKITYPSGGWTKYSWGPVANQLMTVFANAKGTPNTCAETSPIIAISSRSVSYDGTTVALVQNYSYSTPAWNSTSTGEVFVNWSAKTTGITDADQVTGESLTTVYNYEPIAAKVDPTWTTLHTNSGSAYYAASVSYGSGLLVKTQAPAAYSSLYGSYASPRMLICSVETMGGLSSGTFYNYAGKLPQVIDKREYDFGNVQPSDCVSYSQTGTMPTATASRETSTTYQTFSKTSTFPYSISIFDRPSSITLTGIDPRTAATAQFGQTSLTYDQGSVTDVADVAGHDSSYGTSLASPRGNITTITKSTGPGSYITSTYTYDITGQPLSITDACGNTTCSNVSGSSHTKTFSYTDQFPNGGPSGGVANSYVTQITDHVTSSTIHVTKFKYDYPTGHLVETDDENSQPTKYTYNDVLGRLTAVIEPPVNGSSSTTTYAYSDGTFPSITVTDPIGAQTQTIYDGVLHPRKVVDLSDPLGKVYTRTIFDGKGRVYQAWNPTRIDPDSGSCSSESTCGITTTHYDVLGRITSVVEQDGSTKAVSYSANTVTSTDEAGRAVEVVHDGLGRIATVWEPDASTGELAYETDYLYDPHNNLVRVTQKGNDTTGSLWRIRNFQYDWLSHMTTMSIPELGNGQYTAVYDANGNRISETVPSPNQAWGSAGSTTIGYCYDDLNRLVAKTYSGAAACSSSSLVAQYGYDAGSYGIGRRTSMGDLSGSSSWSYDPMGRTNSVTRTINGVTKTATYSYYLNSALKSLTYFDGSIINYGINADGQPLSAVDSGGLLSYVSSATTYTPGGAIQSMTRGANSQSGFSGVTTSSTYNSRLMPAVLSGSLPSGTVLSLSYCYLKGGCAGTLGTNNGNVTEIDNNLDSTRNEIATYDYLNRVTEAKAGTKWSDAYTYDPWGNLLSKAPLSGAGIGENLPSTGTNVYNQAAGLLTYDAAGNVISDNASIAYVYDAENRVLSAAGVTYAYDGDGKRVMKTGSANVLYWRGAGGSTLDETDLSGQNAAKNIYFGGAQVARVDSSGVLHYPFHDSLGSMRTSVQVSLKSPNGTVETDLDYYPFGTPVAYSSDSSGNPYKFTGKERDPETGNDYFEVRYFNASVSRMFSIDPGNAAGFAHMGDPQSWNAYSYVRNNPLTLTDPSGTNYNYTINNNGNGTSGVNVSDAAFYTILRGYIESSTGPLTFTGSLSSAGSLVGPGFVIQWTYLAQQQNSQPVEVAQNQTPATPAQSQQTPPITYVDGSRPVAPNAPLGQLLACTANCLNTPLTVTSTNEPVPAHPADTPHGRGEAADLRVPAGQRDRALQCAANCGAGFGQNEYAHPVPHHTTGGHVHIQTGPGRGGGRGELPRPQRRPEDE